MRPAHPFALALVLGLASIVVAPPAGWGDDSSPRYDRRWVWVMSNLLVDEEAERVVALVERAGRDGYNGLVLSDYKLNFLGRMPKTYFDHVARVKEAARLSGVEIIPALFPIGYSNGLLANDRNMAEGMPAESSFEVRGKVAVPVVDPAIRLNNGGLEATRGEGFAGFGFQDAPGKATVIDREVKHGGASSCRMGEFASNPVSRLIQSVKVHPRGCYSLSAWIKTSELAPTGSFRLMAMGKASGRPLSFHEGGIGPTQDWTRVEVAFNTQGETEVNLFAGAWGAKSGTIWVDDLELEELPLVNPLRREGCPLTVASEDGQTIYAEGADFEPVVDPLLDMVPYEGEYRFDHPGASLRLTPGSKIKDGQRLKVGWYHPVLTHGSNVACCLSEPKVDDLLKDQAKRVANLFEPRTFFMQHDEMRVANWCQACRSRSMTPGQLLADNARRCVAILREIRPSAEVAVWSDLFDPNHNAVDDYYLVNGSLRGAWLGLAPEVIIANWNSGKAKTSLEFFAGRGHRQVLAGYYDGDDNLKTWDDASRGVPNVLGFMYTTWENRYGDLERYGKALTGKK